MMVLVLIRGQKPNLNIRISEIGIGKNGYFEFEIEVVYNLWYCYASLCNPKPNEDFLYSIKIVRFTIHISIKGVGKFPQSRVC